MLSIENLTLRGPSTQRLEGISLRLRPGSLHTLLGPNGSGKSTLLRSIVQLLTPSGGSISYEGTELSSLGREQLRRLIGYVPHPSPSLFSFPVHDFVEMGLYANPTEKKNRVEWALEEVHALHLINRATSSISQGERQRIYLARALVNDPPILLVDEPTASLDLREKRRVWRLLQKLSSTKAVLVATHDLAESHALATSVTLLERGRCLYSGSNDPALLFPLLEQMYGTTSVSSPADPCDAHTRRFQTV